MMPGIHLCEERRKKRARVGAFIALSAVAAVTVLLQPGYQWVSLTVGVCSAIAVAASGGLPSGGGRGGRMAVERHRTTGYVPGGAPPGRLARVR